MVDALPEESEGAPPQSPPAETTPWLIPLPVPPPILEIDRRVAGFQRPRSKKSQANIASLNLNPGAPDYLWSAARNRRPDGRESAHQLRPLEAQTSVFGAADGSCRLMQGDTSVVAFVTGPVASSLRRNTNLREAFCEVLVRPRIGTSQQSDKRLECELQSIVQRSVNVQLYPRTTLQIVVQVVGEDGPLMSTCVNAICLALLDAGVNLRFTFAATCVAIRPLGMRDNEETNGFLLDPTTDELDYCSGALCLVFDVGTGGVIASSSERDLVLTSTKEMDELIRLGYAASVCTGDFFRRQLEGALKRVALTVEAQNWFTLDPSS